METRRSFLGKALAGVLVALGLKLPQAKATPAEVYTPYDVHRKIQQLFNDLGLVYTAAKFYYSLDVQYRTNLSWAMDAVALVPRDISVKMEHIRKELMRPRRWMVCVDCPHPSGAQHELVSEVKPVMMEYHFYGLAATIHWRAAAVLEE